MEHRRKRSERIKPIDIVSVSVLLVIAAVLTVLIYFCFHPITQNVFDQLYYEVRAVYHRRSSVLVSGTSPAYANYEYGSVMGVLIPEPDMYIDISGDTLELWFFHFDPDDDRRVLRYEYNLKEKQLSGELPVEFLADNFLTEYFAWYSSAGKSNPYSQEDLGEYEFTLRENAHAD